MWFPLLFNSSNSRSRRSAARRPRILPRPRRFRPGVCLLEDRTLLSTYVVDGLGDTGAGSGLTGDLRYCITNATSGTDDIAFGVTGTIQLESALPALNTSVAIQGPGANQLTVARDPVGNSLAIFVVGSAATVQISGLTLSSANLGAIENAGTLTVSACTLSGNTNSSGPGGAISNTGTLTISYSNLLGNNVQNGLAGGAIFNTGTLIINDSTVAGNTAYGGSNVSPNNLDAAGGAIDMAGGSLTINSSTLANNLAAGGVGGVFTATSFGGTFSSTYGGNGSGGGLYITGGTVSIDHSTIAGNQAQGGVADSPGVGTGGGIDNVAGPSAVQLFDTILAGNTADQGPDLEGGFTSLGHNLIGNTT